MAPRPAIVIDIDDTIVNPSRRKARAFIDAVRSMGTAISNPAIVKKIGEAAGSSYDFSPMKRIVDKEIDDLVYQRFLSNDYLVMNGRVMDDPVPGSVKFLNDAALNGCMITYLTGRSFEEWQDKRKKTTKMTGMVPGTIESLRKLGYPVPAYPSRNDDPVQIVFKNKRWRKDDEYKPSEIRGIQRSGRDIVAIFDDSKKVLEAVKKEFPGISRVAVMIYPDMKGKDYGCLPKAQKKITEYMTEKIARGGIECIKGFSRVVAMPGCKILVDGKPIA